MNSISRCSHYEWRVSKWPKIIHFIGSDVYVSDIVLCHLTQCSDDVDGFDDVLHLDEEQVHVDRDEERDEEEGRGSEELVHLDVVQLLTLSLLLLKL